jgi:predicted porin
MKRTIFLVLLSTIGICDATENTGANVAEKELLLNEIVADELNKEGIDLPLSFRGTFNLTSIFVNQDKKNGGNSCIVALESDVFLKYLKNCNQCNFGFEIGAKGNSGIMKQGSPILRTAYLFAGEDELGTLRIGFTPTMADSMTISVGNVLVGYGGAASRNLSLFYNESAGSFIDLCFPFDDNKAAKIAYMSPTFSGFSFGLSFTPDSRSANPFKTLHPRPRNPEINQEKANFPGMRSAYSRNIITGGIAYELGDPEALNGKISLCGWIGKGRTSVIGVEVENIRAYSIGAVLGYKDFKLALGYADNGKSLRSKRYATADISVYEENRNYTFADPEVGLKQGADAGKMYSIGASYAVTSKFTVSTGYFRSEVKFSDSEKSTANVFTLGGEYVFHRSVCVYVEYDKINSDSCARAQAYGKACGISDTGKNSGYMFMIGTKINI